MFLNYGVVIQILLLVAGLWWCKEVFDRRREDVALLREPKDNVKRGIVVFFWTVTLVIAALIVRFAWRVVQNIRAAL